MTCVRGSGRPLRAGNSQWHSSGGQWLAGVWGEVDDFYLKDIPMLIQFVSRVGGWKPLLVGISRGIVRRLDQ